MVLFQQIDVTFEAIDTRRFEILLIFAGLVKINPDWLQLEPLSMWLAKRDDFPVLGYLFTQDWSVAIAAYGVILLHIVGAPLFDSNVNSGFSRGNFV